MLEDVTAKQLLYCLFILLWHSFLPHSQGLFLTDCTQADFQLMLSKPRDIPVLQGLVGHVDF